MGDKSTFSYAICVIKSVGQRCQNNE